MADADHSLRGGEIAFFIEAPWKTSDEVNSRRLFSPRVDPTQLKTAFNAQAQVGSVLAIKSVNRAYETKTAKSAETRK